MHRPVTQYTSETRLRIIGGIATVALLLGIAALVVGIIALTRQGNTTVSSTDGAALFLTSNATFASVYTGCMVVTPRFTANVSVYLSSDNHSATIQVEADTTPFVMTLPLGGCSAPIEVGAEIPLVEALVPFQTVACGGALGLAGGTLTLFIACAQGGKPLSIVPLVNGSLAWTAGVTYAPPPTWTMAYLINNP